MEVESALDGIRTPWDATFNVALVSIRETSSSKVPSNSPSVSQGMNLKYPSAVAATLNTIFRLIYSQKVSKISFTINITSTSPSGKPVWCITSRCIIFYFWLILSIMGDTLIYSKNGHRLTKFESYTLSSTQKSRLGKAFSEPLPASQRSNRLNLTYPTHVCRFVARYSLFPWSLMTSLP